MMLSDVYLTSKDVCRVHREYSWRPQLLEARRAGRRRAGVRRVWTGAGPQRAAYRGGAYLGGLPSTACFIMPTCFLINILSIHVNKAPLEDGMINYLLSCGVTKRVSTS